MPHHLSKSCLRAILTGAPILALALASTTAVRAASKPFPAPAGWDAVQSQAPSNTQSFQMWKRDSGDLQQTVIVIGDPATDYNEAVQRIHKNIADNKFKVKLDKDQSCDGKTGHLFEMVYGPEAKRIAVDRLVVPDGTGITQITYMRPEPEPFAAEVKTNLNSYCGTTVI
ncbi:MAG: hypothetical protein JO359_09815 [Candidatus Eremiobacteraeota bacterium]|nr:hypothetical protein [Candidatus Eremiobacteraeota bacterium]